MKIRKEAKDLMKLWGGFRAARVLLTANNFGIFEHLESSKTVKEIAKILNTDIRATELLLDALTGLGLVKKSAGLLKRTISKYKNTALSKHLLVKGQPYYQGDILRHAATLWDNWSGLDDAVKTGKPQHRSHDHDAFIRGMHNVASLKAEDVIKAINVKGVKKALDLGGGPGTYAMAMAKKGIAVTLFDSPETIAIAKNSIGKSGKELHFIGGDFLSDELGQGYDLVLISQILHAYSERENIHLLEKSKEALQAGGRIIIQEFFIDRTRTSPSQGTLFSINMLVNTDGGRCYSPSEISQWLSRTGFCTIKEKLLDDTVLISAKKT